jgi:hypothetical protein
MACPMGPSSTPSLSDPSQRHLSAISNLYLRDHLAWQCKRFFTKIKPNLWWLWISPIPWNLCLSKGYS